MSRHCAWIRCPGVRATFQATWHSHKMLVCRGQHGWLWMLVRDRRVVDDGAAETRLAAQVSAFEAVCGVTEK